MKNNYYKPRIRVLERPTRISAGKALINGKIYHYIKGRWVYCGDCNRR